VNYPLQKDSCKNETSTLVKSLALVEDENFSFFVVVTLLNTFPISISSWDKYEDSKQLPLTVSDAFQQRIRNENKEILQKRKSSSQ
jgi:hypothetical protein